MATFGRINVSGRQWPINIAMLGCCAAAAIAAALQPLVTLVLFGSLFFWLLFRSAALVSAVLLSAGPMLASRFQVGPLTLDNWITIAGSGLGVIALLRSSDRQIDRRLLALPVALASAVILSSIANGTNSLPALIRFTGLALLPLLVTAAARSHPRRAVGAFLGTVCLGGASVLAQPFIGFPQPYIDPDTLTRRYGGLFGHPNFAACVLSIAIIYASRALPRRVALPVSVICAAGIVSTGSLGALGALALGLLIVHSDRLPRLLAAGGLVVLAALMSGVALTERLSAINSTGGNINSVSWRLNRWHDALNLAPDPNIWGIGWEQIEFRLSGPAHSSYVAIYVELGLCGALLVVAGLAAFLRSFGATRLAFGLAAFVLISSVTDPVLFYPSALAAWLFVASLMAVQREVLTQRARATSGSGQKTHDEPRSHNLREAVH